MSTATKDISVDEQNASAALVAALREECDRQGKPIGHLAALLGLAPTYWAAICSGSRSILPLAEKQKPSRIFADFLGLPRITVLSMAGVVLAEDFVVDQSLGDQLNAVYLQMSNDPLWSTLVPRPTTWDAANQAMKLLIVSLYQASLQSSMLAKAGKTMLDGTGFGGGPLAEPRQRSAGYRSPSPKDAELGPKDLPAV